ncbi:MAG: hypothetical protein LC754_14225, partial [Acidobacteria bacterium]|nr:hypothetical protein [Acidobacteriota bacterium]
MREFMKSMFGFSWAMSLFGARQLGNSLRADAATQQQSAAELDAVTHAAEEQMGDTLKSLFKSGDRIQRGVVDMMSGAPRGSNAPGASASPGGGAQSPSSQPTNSNTSSSPAHGTVRAARVPSRVNPGRLDASAFVVLGEGLAAGMGDFTLSEETQRQSFPAQMAEQMQTPFPQPLIQAPGICSPAGFAEMPVLIPSPLQTTVFDQVPPPTVSNFSVPGYRLTDALNLRPSQPVINRESAKQTACNLILGILPLARGTDGALPTQLECALARRPTLTFVELGYQEAIEAAVKGDPDLLPSLDSFRADYARLLQPLRQCGSEVLALTIPDPFVTAHFSDITLAAKIIKVEPSFLLNVYGLSADDLVTVNGLNEISFQLFGKSFHSLPEGSILNSEIAREISRRIGDLNAALITLAQEHGALVYDLDGLFRKVKHEGISLGTRQLTAEYLGGFYSLNGYYPGATGHAIIASELLHLLNLTYGADFPQADVQGVSMTDPVAAYEQAGGPVWPSSAMPLSLSPAATNTSDFALGGSDLGEMTAVEQSPSGWEELGQPQGESAGVLRLPEGLEQVLPLSKAASYFGDGIGAVNCRDPQGIQWGSCSSWLFGGLALVDSHLSGYLRIRFTPPAGNVTRFEVSFLDGFAGEDAVLTTPQFFKMWFQQARVDEVPGMVSSGTLNLATGDVSDLKFYARYSSTALFALVGVNPTFPRVPLSFPGQYGSAWARFEQRADGKLDFTFYGSTFVPLGNNLRWPLNFVGPSGQFATVPSNGTTMHPHLHLSTREPAPPAALDQCPDIPFNTIQEFTLFSHNSSFGDAFTLDSSQLGGRATGRSHLLGRVLIQFGVRSYNSVPIAVSCVSAGGMMSEMPASPITAVFPGRLYPGPQGFDEFLRFPLRTYSLDDLAIIDDPFDISVGSVDLRTGMCLNEMLHRGFINQDL